jgi:hypothetical protein
MQVLTSARTLHKHQARKFLSYIEFIVYSSNKNVKLRCDTHVLWCIAKENIWKMAELFF